MSNFNIISEIIGSAQRNTAVHQKCVTRLMNIFLSEDFDTCFLNFKKCIYSFLLTDYKLEKHQFVERLIQFLSLYCTTMQDYHLKNVDPETDSKLLIQTIQFLTEMSGAASDSVRYRACEFISRLFAAMTGFDLTEELCDTVQEIMLNKLEDKLPQVRMHAVRALGPLQNHSVHCPIIASFLEHMEYDPSAKVRRMCVEKIILKREAISHLINVSLDVDANVRLEVYKRALKYPNHFKISQKQRLLLNAIHDKSETVKRFVSQQMIPAWLQSTDVDYIKLISSLRLDSTWKDLEDTTRVVEFTLRTLFNSRPLEEVLGVLNIDEKKLVKTEDLTWDIALFWRYLVEHLRRPHVDLEDIDKYIPQIPDLGNYIEQYCVYSMNKINSNPDEILLQLKFKFILVQLFYIVETYDFCDISCRKIINELIQHVLRTYFLDLEVVNPIISVFNITMPNIHDQARVICEMLSSDLLYSQQPSIQPAEQPPTVEPPAENAVLNSTQAEYEVAKLKLKIYELSEELEEAVRVQDFLTASELKQQLDPLKLELSMLKRPVGMSIIEDETDEPEDADVEEERVKQTDPMIIQRSLNVMAGFLTTSNVQSLSPTLNMFKINFIDDWIHHENIRIKIAAMRCLGLCCVIDEHTASIAIPAFVGVIVAHNRLTQSGDYSSLVLICAGTIMDSIIKFGTKVLANVRTDISDSGSDEGEVFQNGTSLTAIINELLNLLNDDNVKIQDMAARGFCHFILTSRIQSHSILTRLILKYVLPVDFDDQDSLKLQQYIAVTLSKLPRIPGAAVHFKKAVIPAMHVILKAPRSSPLATINVENTAKLLMDIAGCFPEADDNYYYLTFMLLKEIRDKPNNPHNFMLSKIILMAKFTSRVGDDFTNHIALVDEIRDRVVDKKILANIIKFNTKMHLQAGDGNPLAVTVAENENEDKVDDEEEASEDEEAEEEEEGEDGETE